MEYVATAACKGKCQARLPTFHFERILEEACSNHAYPINQKLKDCGMMMNFMTVYDGSFPPRRRRMSNLSPGTPTHCGWGL
jgi:hypothetical protein